MTGLNRKRKLPRHKFKASGWVGKKVLVEYGGDHFPATITEDDNVASCTVLYENEEFGTELNVLYDRIKDPEA